MSTLFTVRWSGQEAIKSYARPFAITFQNEVADLGSLAVNGVDLLYYHQFQGAVLQWTGCLFEEPALVDTNDPQRAWLDVLGALLPKISFAKFLPVSMFDEQKGRIFRFTPDLPDYSHIFLDAAQLIEYQTFQAVIAHQTGQLFRDSEIELIDNERDRQQAWVHLIQGILAKEALAQNE